MSSFKKDNVDSKIFSDPEEADDECLLPETGPYAPGRAVPRTTRSSRWSRYGTAIGIPTLLCVTNLFTYWITNSARLQCPVQASVAEPPNLTPMLRDLNLKTRQVKFDSSFFSQGSPYRQRPSLETDSAWDYAGANCIYHLLPSSPLRDYYTDLEAVGFLLIPEDQEQESDLTPDHIHLVGSANQSYLKGIPADVEVFHQLHCLVWKRTMPRDQLIAPRNYFARRHGTTMITIANKARENFSIRIETLKSMLVSESTHGLFCSRKT